jgi:hypothetical protein
VVTESLKLENLVTEPHAASPLVLLVLVPPREPTLSVEEDKVLATRDQDVMPQTTANPQDPERMAFHAFKDPSEDFALEPPAKRERPQPRQPEVPPLSKALKYFFFSG